MSFPNNGFIPGLGSNITLAQIDNFYDPESENAQSGKAVAYAISNIKLPEGGDVKVDQTYNPKSSNAQSGKSLAPVFQKKLDWWQPNIEYKRGDIAACMMEYQGNFQLVFMGCITDHISEGDATDDSPIPSPYQTQLDYWYIEKTRVSRADEAVYANNAEFDVDGKNIIATYATKEELGAIDDALDTIIDIQRQLLGGDDV